MSGAGGKTHSVIADRPAEARKGRDEGRQEKIIATGFGKLTVPTVSRPQF